MRKAIEGTTPKATATVSFDTVSQKPAGGLLAIAISAAVPLRIIELVRRGGPSDADVKAAGEFSQVLGEKGDRLLFRSSVPGETADLFNRLAESIAVLSFCPGGVTMFGQKYEATDYKRFANA